VNEVFADAFYWIALTDRRDARHEEAIETSRALRGTRLVSTEEVLVEYLAYCRGIRLRERAAQTVRFVLGSSAVRVVPQSHESFLAGLDLYAERSDKSYSLVDCISLETMRRERLSEALTNDHHFEQEGFRALFRPRL